MEDKFDNYLKKQLESIQHNHISSHLWNKEKSWAKINSGLQAETKMISISWLYAAASILIVLLSGSMFFYKNYTIRITQISNENEKLTEIIKARQSLTSEIQITKVDTVFIVKEIRRNAIPVIADSLNDTVEVIANKDEPSQEYKNDEVAMDTSYSIMGNKVADKKIKFVMSNEIQDVKNEYKRLFVSSKSILEKQEDHSVTEELPFKFYIN